MNESSEKKIKLSRTKNAVRNIYSGMFNKIFTIFFPFLIRTVLIKKIGIEYAGLNSLFSSILQVLNLTELGFASAVVYSMYKPIAEDDKDTICALLNFYKRVYFIIGLVILALGTAVMPFLPHLIKGNVPQDINIYVLYSIYLVNTSLSYLLFGYKNSLLNAHQRRDVISNILTITQGLMNICQLFILVTIKNYYLYVLMMPIFTVLNNVMVGIETKRMFPEYSCKGKLNIAVKKDIRKKVAGLMISKICQISRNSLDSIFISAFLGLTITAIYSNYFLILTSISSFMGIITTSIQAGIGNSINTESVEKNYINMKMFNFLYTWLAGFCCICMACLYQPFIELWIGKEYLLPTSAVILICIYFYIMKAGDITANYCNAVGIWWENKYRYIAETVCNFILNIALVKFFGIHGLIIATIITMLFIGHGMGNQVLFRKYFKNIKLTNWIFCVELKNFLITSIAGVITFFICIFIDTKFSLNLYIKIIIRLAVCVFFSNAILYLLYKRTNEYKDAKKWILNKRKTNQNNRRHHYETDE